MENSVEKKQGRSAKDIVASDGISAFCDMCRSDVMTYSTEWESFIARMGRWVQVGDEYGYKTMNKKYMESMLWTLKTLFERGLLYKDYSVNPFDWVNGTVVSNSEASQDYREIVDDAVTVWFELENGDRVIAWTTTPWTLPANSALAGFVPTSLIFIPRDVFWRRKMMIMVAAIAIKIPVFKELGFII